MRAPFERALGRDFADVRIHPASGPRASTLGVDVALPEGRPAATQQPEDWVLAHELAHVVQRSRGGTAHDPEARATEAADAVLAGAAVAPESLGGAPLGAQLQPQPKGEDAPPAEAGSDQKAEGAPGAKMTSGTGLDGFARDKALLSKQHLESLDQLAWSINLHLGMLKAGHASIQVVGHTDTTGTEKHNVGLGQQRADAARAALEEALKRHGVTPDQLDAIGTKSAGESDLAVKTADEVDEPRNRRVHIEVTITAPAPPTTKPPVGGPIPPGGQGPSGPGIGTPLPPGPGPVPATPSRPWLEEALRKDDLLKQLPKWARDKAIDGLKDMDETAVEKVIDAVPWDDKAKEAAKAALKALLRTLKGQKFKPPEPPPRSPEFGPEREFPKAPGEKIFKLPPIRFDWP
jgi:outer membrane protein OmpA-like peptidoglycan-associated protein